MSAGRENPAYLNEGDYPPHRGGPQEGYDQPPGDLQKHGRTRGQPSQPSVTTVSVAVVSETRAWDDGDFASDAFSEKRIRMAFIRKVYLILMAQLIFTCAVTAFFLLHEPTQIWVQDHGWIYYIAYAVFLVTYIVLVCCPSVRRKWPVNMICLGIFTIALTYMTAMISSFYGIQAVLIGLGITTAVTLVVSIFACQTKFDFTMCGGLLCIGVLVLFLFGIASMSVYFISPGSIGSTILQCVYGALGALLFSLFLAYDTQMLIGGKKHEISPEDHVYAALQLYLDIVLIFMYILSSLGGE